MGKVETINYFVALPGRVLADDSLTALDFRALGVVAAHDRMGRNGQCCWAGRKKLAELVNCDPTRLSASLSKLVAKGYLEEVRNEADKRQKGFRIVYQAKEDAAGIGSKVRENRLQDRNLSSADRLPDGNVNEADRLPKPHLSGRSDARKTQVNQLVKSSLPNPNIFRETEDITRKRGLGVTARPPDRVLAELLGGAGSEGWTMLAALSVEDKRELADAYVADTLTPDDLARLRERHRRMMTERRGVA